MGKIKDKIRSRMRRGIAGKGVRLKRPYRGHPAGAVIYPPAGQRQILVSDDVAEVIEIPAVEQEWPPKTEDVVDLHGPDCECCAEDVLANDNVDVALVGDKVVVVEPEPELDKSKTKAKKKGQKK